MNLSIQLQKIFRKYKKGILGPFRGKVGTTVGSSWNGIFYLKSLPDFGDYVPSTAQLNVQAKMAFVTGFLKPLKPLLNIGYKLFNKGITPMNGAVSLLLKEAVTGNSRENYAIDFAKVILNRGELLISLIKQVLVLIDSVLQIKWENPSASVFCKANDKATVVVYNNAKQKFVIFKDVAKRADEQVDLQLPANFAGDAIHAWAHYVSLEGTAVSTSVYIGEYVI